MSATVSYRRPRSGPRAALPPSPELGRRLARSPLVVALDIDGTLAPLAATPGAAVVPQETLVILTALAERRDVHVVFVTGRAAPDGRRLADVPNSWVIGNHGMESIDPAGTVQVNLVVEPYAPRIARAFATLRDRIGTVPGVILEDKLWTLSVHYRLADHAEVPAIERVVREIAAAEDVRLTEGKEIFELRPPVDINKGTATAALAAQLGVRSEDGSAVGAVFYAGDDRTDEDAFRLLRERAGEAVTVHVGSSLTEAATPTAAEFLVADPAEMLRLLEWLVTRR